MGNTIDWLGDVLLLPTILLFFGALVWVLGLRNESGGAKARGPKIVALVLVLLAAFAAFDRFAQYAGLFNYNALHAAIYQEQAHGRRNQIAHYAAFLMPIGFLLIMGIVEIVRKVRRADDY